MTFMTYSIIVTFLMISNPPFLYGQMNFLVELYILWNFYEIAMGSFLVIWVLISFLYSNLTMAAIF